MVEEQAKCSNSVNGESSNNILVVGDWIIDENWIVTTESISTSSHVGDYIYRSRIDSTKAQILSLCGAGSIASLLNLLASDEKLKKSNPKWNVYGIGRWDTKDTRLLASLFDQKERISGQTPRTLYGMETNPPTAWPETFSCLEDGLSVLCLDCKKKEQDGSVPDCERLFCIDPTATGGGTCRVVRVYQCTGKQEPRLLSRYDWGIEKIPPTITAENYGEQLQKLPEEKQGKMTYIVVADHDKGVMSDALAEALLIRYKNATWYVRAKRPDASWIDKVRKTGNLGLLVLGPMNLPPEVEPPFLGSHLSWESIKFLEKYAGIGAGRRHYSTWPPVNGKNLPTSFHGTATNSVVAHHDNGRMAALILDKREGGKIEDKTKLYASEAPLKEPRVKAGRTSHLFAALVATHIGLIKDDTLVKPGASEPGSSEPSVLSQPEDNLKPLTEDCLKLSLGVSRKWCRVIGKVLEGNPNQENQNQENQNNDPNEWVTFRGSLPLLITDNDYDSQPKDSPTLVDSTYKGEKKDWLSAVQGCGEVSDTKGAKLQIWRSWSAVPQTIALSPRKREGIARLVKEVRTFVADHHRKHSLSAMLVANPGAGKTFFVEQLARDMHLDHYEFNITHLSSTDDLVACFDQISSLQNQKGKDSSRPIVVFFDEINARLAGEPVYSYFLSPLSDGTYRRGGFSFSLKPCIWIFAGTRSPKEGGDDGSKGSDFLSRITVPVIKFDNRNVRRSREKNRKQPVLNKPEQKQAALNKLEQVYMAAALIRLHYPDVEKVSRQLLRFFLDNYPKYDSRSLSYLVRNLRDVSHGRVDLKNLPNKEDMESWLQEVPEIPSEDADSREKWVTLESVPPK